MPNMLVFSGGELFIGCVEIIQLPSPAQPHEVSHEFTTLRYLSTLTSLLTILVAVIGRQIATSTFTMAVTSHSQYSYFPLAA